MLLSHHISMFLMKIYFNHRILLSFRQCSISKEMLQPPARTISETDRDFVFIKCDVFIPEGSRCCDEPVFHGRLRPNAFDKVRPYKITNTSFSFMDVIIWFDKFRDHCNSVRYFDFDLPFTMSGNDCYNLIGILKLNFEHLIQLLADSSITHSSNRSFRNAVGLFLTKLRLGISNKVLTSIFQFANPQAVSRTLSTVRQAILSNFVPQYLGFNHISRQDVIHNRSSSLATRLLTDHSSTAVLVIDGTYLYVQVCNVYFCSQ